MRWIGKDSYTNTLCTKNSGEDHKFNLRFEATLQVALTHTDQSITVLSPCHSQIRTPLDKAETGCLKRTDCSFRLRYKEASYSKQYNYHLAADLKSLSLWMLLVLGNSEAIWITLAFRRHLLPASSHLWAAHVTELWFMVYRVVVSLLDTSGTQAAVVYIKYVSTS